MSAIKSAVCLIKSNGCEVEESFHASEVEAIRRLTTDCNYCGWLHTAFFGGEAIIYEGDEVIGIAQVRVLGY